MAQAARKALAGGFNGSGDGDVIYLLHLLENDTFSRKFQKIQGDRDYRLAFTDDVKTAACVQILQDDRFENIAPQEAATLEMLLHDFPNGYLKNALGIIGVQDIKEWLEERTFKSQVLSPNFN